MYRTKPNQIPVRKGLSCGDQMSRFRCNGFTAWILNVCTLERSIANKLRSLNDFTFFNTYCHIIFAF